MAFDAFLKIEGIDGESTDDKHKKEIEVLSYHWSIAQTRSGSASSGGSLTAERASFDPLTVVKALDIASPKLALACASGEAFKNARLELCRAGGDKQPYMEYKLSDVMISSVRPGGTGAGQESLPLEEISISYGKIEWKYTKIDVKTGKAAGNAAGGWDLESNKKV